MRKEHEKYASRKANDAAEEMENGLMKLLPLLIGDRTDDLDDAGRKRIEHDITRIMFKHLELSAKVFALLLSLKKASPGDIAKLKLLLLSQMAQELDTAESVSKEIKESFNKGARAV